MRILIVDDHDVIRRGVRAILSERKDIEICGEAVDGRDAIEKARELKPDAIIMDVNMPNLGGFQATREIKKFLPEVSVIVLSIHDGHEATNRAKFVGAQAYVGKMRASMDLLKALDAILQKKEFFPDEQSSTGLESG
jgi:DNA-binding NarL/FixJ family response regulator